MSIHEEDYVPPFTKSFVLEHTIKHMSESIAFSIDKCERRLQHFQDDPEKEKEVLDTINTLHLLRSNVVRLMDHELFQ